MDTGMMSSTNIFDQTIVTINKPKVDTSHVKISLVDEKLWEKFHAYVNEMIVTKDGR